MGIPQKGIVGSNPILSATFIRPFKTRAYVIVSGFQGQTMTKNYDQPLLNATGHQEGVGELCRSRGLTYTRLVYRPET